MEISETLKDNVCKLSLEGRLDTMTAPELDAKLSEVIGKEISELTLDFRGLEYISSAGLRVLLRGQKMMNGKGTMVITNVKDELMEIFEMTGFNDILNIQ
ncbi:MAG: STAS domain-containing protein [Erysipelotrichaceae bacterium]|nr:STAS domain-containing protein [Erysipelotrichaceae bacterium]